MMKFAPIAAASLLVFGLFAVAAPATYAEGDSASVKSMDVDHDGTIGIGEATKAGMAKFAAMDKDNDGTVDAKEAGMDVSMADPDKDGTLDKGEYEAALGKTFEATDTDHDGTVDAKELATPEGRKLEAMMK